MKLVAGVYKISTVVAFCMLTVARFAQLTVWFVLKTMEVVKNYMLDKKSLNNSSILQNPQQAKEICLYIAIFAAYEEYQEFLHHCPY